MRPYDVTDSEQLLEMESDNHPQDRGRWSILHNGDHVSLHPPANAGRGQYVTIPRSDFNAIVDWYMADQRKGHPIMTQTELREKVRGLVSDAELSRALDATDQATDAIMALVDQVRADERERLAKLAGRDAVYRWSRYGNMELEWEYDLADWLRAQGDKP